MAQYFGRLFWYLEKGDGSMALWGGRFEAGVAEVTQEFGASLPVDKHLYKQDIDAGNFTLTSTTKTFICPSRAS